MRKLFLRERQKSPVAYVERAAWLSRELTRMKARGPGDTENAMRAIGRDYGVDYGIIWRLRDFGKVGRNWKLVAAVARAEYIQSQEVERGWSEGPPTGGGLWLFGTG